MKINRNDVLRHNFAIWVMGRRPGWFKPQRYLYRCLRCKWAFMVNDDHSGSVRIAADRATEVTPVEEKRRLASFVSGPCPGYQTGIELGEQLEDTNVIPLRRQNRAGKTARNARAM
jgi:hypothetical protein